MLGIFRIPVCKLAAGKHSRKRIQRETDKMTKTKRIIWETVENKGDIELYEIRYRCVRAGFIRISASVMNAANA